jgi:hypothetical protein
MARTSTGKAKRRINLDLDLSSLEKIDEVKDKLHADSMIEVIRRSIDMMHYVTIQDKDAEIRLHIPGKVPELIKPF